MKKKRYDEMEKVYMVCDKWNEKVTFIYMAMNELDLIRNMVWCGFFQTSRVMDTKIIETGYAIENNDLVAMGKRREIEIEPCLEKLSIQIENKAKEIDETKEELTKNLEKGNLDKVKEDTVICEQKD